MPWSSDLTILRRELSVAFMIATGWAVFLIVLAIIAGLIGIGAIGIVAWQRRRRTTFVKYVSLRCLS